MDWHHACYGAGLAIITVAETDAVSHGGKASEGTITHALRHLIGPRWQLRWCVAAGVGVWTCAHLLLGVHA